MDTELSVPTMPDSLVAAMLRGTAEVPQADIAAAAMVGASAIQLMERKELTWSELDRAVVSDEQGMGMIARAVNVMHGQAGITRRFDQADPTARLNPENLKLNRLRGHVMSRRDDVIAASGVFINTLHAYDDLSKFGRVMVKLGLRRLEPVSRVPEETLAILDSNHYAADTTALGMVWQTAAGILRRPDVHAKAEAYRNSISHYYSLGNKTRIYEISSKQGDRLRRQMQRAVLSQRPTIANATGRRLPRAVVTSFTHTLLRNRSS